MATRVDRPGYLVRVATEALRELIARQELGPGGQLRQAELARRLGVSRTPLREAMRVLAQEGLLVHEPNHGYRVARLSTDELVQIYRMRELLERDLMTSLRWPTDDQLVALRALNESIANAVADGAVRAMVKANRAFHFAMFELSPLAFLRAEVERLWRLCEPYHAAYLSHPATREGMVAEHDQMIAALADRDRDLIAALVDEHRHEVEATLRGWLSTQ